MAKALEIVMPPVADLAPVDPNRSRVAARLDAIARAIEGRFVQMGNVLSAAVDGIGDLIASLDRLASALDQTMVDATSQDLESAASALRVLPEGLDQRRLALENLGGLSLDLAGHIDEMRSNLAYLRVVAIYIKIAAGGLDGDDAGFALFAQEIADSVAGGTAHLAAFDGDLRSLDSDLNKALAHERGLRTRCSDLVPTTPDAIQANALALAEQRARIASAAQEVAELARAVRKKVGGVLSALQIGDITRQRIEHVQYGLEMLDRLPADLTEDQRARISGVAHDLLVAQLAATVDDFHRDVALIDHNLAGLLADAHEILKLQERAHGRAQREDGDFLRRLETHIDEAIGLVTEVSAADQSALEVGHSVAAAARRLSVRIDGIQRMQADVHQMALNTTLRCGKIGEAGKPLSVIAVELRSHAARLETSATLTLASLGSLTRGACDLTGPEDGASTDTGGQPAAAALGAAIGRVRQAGASGDMSGLAQQGAAVVEALGRATTRMDGEGDLGSNLDAAAEAFLDLVPDGSRDTADISDALAAYLDELAKQYSMSQERDVHRAVVAGLNIPAMELAPAAVKESDDVEDVFF